ncbi:MAG TPA: M1 family metallopeptidase, partial [Kofleriaceae bacterium]|nr:M1 family metallopeptidase [Kofleriaceae bacterium]
MDLRIACLLAAACSSSDPEPEPVPGPAPVPAHAPVPAPASAPVPAAAASPPTSHLPDDAIPLAYDLRLTVDPDVATFTGHVAIRVRLAAPADHVWLNADELDITHATFQRAGDEPAALSPGASGDGVRAFAFGRTLPAGEVALELDYTGRTAHDEEGLFRQRASGRWYLISQGEPVYTRRIAPCFDEPRFKTPWRVTIVAPAADVALANMPQVSERALPGRRREVAFAETPAMPSYLLAIAVGPFDLVEAGTVGRAHVPFRIAALAGQGARVKVAAARVPHLVATAEDLLDDALPLAKLDLVAVPHLFGAMENPGLITFDQRFLVASSAHEALELERVAAHELVHQWFGDLVTPAWWDDLWLAEAFASWLGARVVEHLGYSPDPALHRAIVRDEALVADDAPSVPPLRPTIEHAADAEDEFSAIGYDKGESVLETIAAWLGDDAMFGALRAYLKSHRGGIAIARDLYTSFGAAPARALASYVERAGTPVVELALRCEASPVLAVHVRGAYAVPVCARYGDAASEHRTCALVADRGELALEGGCPTWVVGNDRAGYYDVAWQTQPPFGPLPELARLSPQEAVAAGEDAAAAFARGELSAADALAATERLLHDRSPYAQLGALALARAIDPVVDDATRAKWTAWLAGRVAVGSPHTPVATAIAAEYDALVGPTASVDPDGAFARWLGGHAGPWDWLSLFNFGRTRTRAWRAAHGKLTDAVAKLGGDLPEALGAFAQLCDQTARDDLAAALAAPVK